MCFLKFCAFTHNSVIIATKCAKMNSSGNSFRPKRIMICGASGSGKSTLAARLGQALSLPVIHGDKFFFDPGWVQRPPEVSNALFDEAAMQENWIIDGNNSRTIDTRAQRAELIIYLELGRVRRLRRTLWRTLRGYGRTRPDMAPGCPEQLDLGFQFDWVWGFDRNSGPKMEAFLARWADRRPILRLHGGAAARRFAADPWPVLAAIDPARTRG